MGTGEEVRVKASSVCEVTPRTLNILVTNMTIFIKPVGGGCMLLPAAILAQGSCSQHKSVFMCCAVPMNARFFLCVHSQIVAETHMKDLGYNSDKSSGRLNNSDSFHAAIWTVVILKADSLLVLIDVASTACVVRLKIKLGKPTLPPQRLWP